MRSQNRKRRRARMFKRLLIGLAIVSLIAGIAAVGLYAYNERQPDSDTTDSNEPVDENQFPEEGSDTTGPEDFEDTNGASGDPDEEAEDEVIDIRISAVGDVMVHDDQLLGAYDSESDSYDFTPFFEDVRPYIQEADLAIANLETTLRGPEQDYSGYPVFNAPDDIIDALDYTGFDTIITTNNHSMDTGEEGLRRTVEVINEKGLTPVGTYEEEPDSRVVYKEVEGIQIAILAYTEMVNQIGGVEFSNEEIRPMINLMEEERILTDIEEAKEQESDIILAYMHWGAEYQANPNDAQTRYANLLAENGVDVILGSHPHVIQPTEFIETEENESFVAYSLGNFVSNQRVETLGEDFAPTEDGVIVTIDIQKNQETNETTVEQVEFVPTWVYRNEVDTDQQFEYRILPIEDHLDDSDLPEEIIERLENSYEETNSRIDGGL